MSSRSPHRRRARRRSRPGRPPRPRWWPRPHPGACRSGRRTAAGRHRPRSRRPRRGRWRPGCSRPARCCRRALPSVPMLLRRSRGRGRAGCRREVGGAHSVEKTPLLRLTVAIVVHVPSTVAEYSNRIWVASLPAFASRWTVVFWPSFLIGGRPAVVRRVEHHGVGRELVHHGVGRGRGGEERKTRHRQRGDGGSRQSPLHAAADHAVSFRSEDSAEALPRPSIGPKWKALRVAAPVHGSQVPGWTLGLWRQSPSSCCSPGLFLQ